MEPISFFIVGVIIIPFDNKEDFESDVIVVGAGPAGSAAAYYFASAGHSLLLR